MNQDENVHSVGNLNATDENNGKCEKDNKEWSNGSDGKIVNQDENVHSVGNLNATDEKNGKSEENS